MVVAIQQPVVECTAMFTMCIAKQHPPPCAATIPAQINGGTDVKTVPGQCAGNAPNTLMSANRPRN